MENSAVERFKTSLKESNFVSAFLFLKELQPESSDFKMLIGELIDAVLVRLKETQNSEDKIYLRSLLLLYLKEIPGLASIYREQIRIVFDEKQPGEKILDILKGTMATESVKSISDKIQEDLGSFFSDASGSFLNQTEKNEFLNILSQTESALGKAVSNISDLLHSNPETESPKKTI